MDDALQGGTLYHQFCAKLMQGWGGELGRYKDTDQGKKFLEELTKISIKTVRLLISKLISQGLDRTKPNRLNEQEALVVMGACVGHMDLVVKLKERTSAITSEMCDLTLSMQRCGKEIKTHLESVLRILERSARTARVIVDDHSFENTESKIKRPATATARLFTEEFVDPNSKLPSEGGLDYSIKVASPVSPRQFFPDLGSPSQKPLHAHGPVFVRKRSNHDSITALNLDWSRSGKIGEIGKGRMARSYSNSDVPALVPESICDQKIVHNQNMNALDVFKASRAASRRSSSGFYGASSEEPSAEMETIQKQVGDLIATLHEPNLPLSLVKNCWKKIHNLDGDIQSGMNQDEVIHACGLMC